MKSKIIFNALPPSVKINPSAAFSILKSFMSQNHVESKVIYWNFPLDKFLASEKKNTEWVYRPLVALLPYYYILADDYQDTTALNVVKSFYNRLNPSNIIHNRNSFDYLDEIKDGVIKRITSELDKINFDEVLLWGISAKCFQWISGLVLAHEIKNKNSQANVVFGGFSGLDDALEIMRASKHIDFAIYGEGEFPLLQLYNQLKQPTPDFSGIPRLVYREDSELKISQQQQSEFLDFNNYIFPDYTEYFEYVQQYDTKNIELPINSIRSCRWNRCKFCNYAAGMKYREREPENIVKEIEYMSDKHKITKFNFVDNDVIGKDIKRFDKLLDLLIKSSYSTQRQYTLWFQFILHNDITAEIYKKMALAGCKFMFAGYESITDNLLSKMDKSNRFAHNILYVKYCVKYGMRADANIIRDIPDETIEDVNESSKNLHYLRFYFHGKHFKFTHICGNFTLYKDSKFIKMVSDAELEKLTLDTFYSYLPSKLISKPFNLFGLMRNRLANQNEWSNFSKVEDYYKANRHYYFLFRYNGEIHYREHIDDTLENSILFDEPDYIDTLILANEQVISFDTLKTNLTAKYPDITDDRIKTIISDLKSVFILYASDDLSSIVTIIDMSLVS